MQKIAIAGSNQLSERLIYYFETTGFGKTVGMFDDFESKGKIKFDREVLGKMADIPALYGKGMFDSVAIAVGYQHRSFRKQVYEYLKENQIPVATFIHPSSHVEQSAVIKEGVIILVDCTIDMDVHLHENVLVSSRCFLSHNVSIGRHTYCGPAVTLCGNTEVGECSFLGVGTTSVDGINIGMNVQTAAGCVLTKDVPPDVLMAGVPGVVKKSLVSPNG